MDLQDERVERILRGVEHWVLKVVPMTSISFAVWLGMKRQMGI